MRQVDNVVEVVEGQHAGAKGTIKHIDRTTLFLHSRTHTVNGGIFPVRARSALLAGRMNRGQVNKRHIYTEATKICGKVFPKRPFVETAAAV